MQSILNKTLALLALSFSVLSFAQAGPWSLNDVTYLFPMPINAEVQSKLMVLNTMSLRDGKELVGSAAYQKFFGAYFQNMTALGIRIDPCFRDHFEDKCRRQVRIVWQPLVPFNRKIISVDAALHTFYDLNDSEFMALINELQVLKKKYAITTDNQPLWVHPGFKKDRETDYQKEFMRAILSKIGFSNTTRIAVMRLGGMRGTLWEFQSFDVENGIIRGTTIFDLNAYFQRFENVAPTGEFDSAGSLNDAAKSEHSDQLMKVLDQSNNPALQSVETLKLYLGRAIKLEQTSAHLAGTIDCISCHASTGVKVWAANKLIRQGVQVDLSRKPGRHNYLNRSRTYGPTNNFRALGYISDQVQLSDRLINESALVADWLNESQRKR